MPTPNEVIVEARSWIGTKFHHLGRCKKDSKGPGGVDCGQFLIAVYSKVGCMPAITTEHYPPDFHLHNTQPWYQNLVEQFAIEVLPPPKPGDVVLYKLNNGLVYSHGAIVIEWPKIIHSYISRGVIEMDGTQGPLGGCPRKYFRPKEFVRG